MIFEYFNVKFKLIPRRLTNSCGRYFFLCPVRSNVEKLAASDKRIKTVNEVLNGIKVIKFYGWEITFEKLINKMRDIELKILKKSTILYTFLNFSFTSVTSIVRIISWIYVIII